MKVTDIIFALISGRILGFLVGDFLREWGIRIGFYWILVIWLVLPLVSLACLGVAYWAGKKLLFVFQGVKFLLVGAVATVVDLKLFEFLIWIFPIYILAKGISFIISTFLKYWGNKHWAFQGHESFDTTRDKQENIYKEVMQFFTITLVGLIIDVGFFYYFTNIMGPQFQIPNAVWVKFSVIFAALVAAVWNFLGYKHLVFKK